MSTWLGRHSWSSNLLRAWITVWLLAVPLFHVHPEADLHHGETGHSHGGTVHTVFSPDLAGEFDPRRDATAEFAPPIAHHTAVAGHPTHDADYAELGFSFVNDSTDRTLPKPHVASVLLVEPSAHPAVPAASSLPRELTGSPSHRLFTRDLPSRAPPAPLV